MKMCPSGNSHKACFWFAFLSFFLLSISAVGEERRVLHLWIMTESRSSVTDEFHNILTDQLRSHFLLDQRTLRSSQLQSHLKRISTEQAPLLILICAPEQYQQYLKQPELRTTFAALDLEFYNARQTSFPFFILSKDGKLPLRTPLQFAFINLPVTEVTWVEEADVLTMMSEISGSPKSVIRVYRERGSYPLAKKLHEGSYDAVGIYESEPPVLLDEFQINLSEELKTRKAMFVTLNRNDLPLHAVQVVPGRFGYVPFEYKREFFDSISPGLFLAIPQDLPKALPVVLSNPEDGDSGAISRSLSNTYFLLATKLTQFLPLEQAGRVEHLYLLNAYLSDPDNRLKGIAYLSELLLRRSDGDDFRKQLYDLKIELLRKDLRLSAVNARAVLDWLGIQIPEISKRERFSSDVSRLYQDALKRIEEGLQLTGERKLQMLQEGRTKLIAAILQADQPRAVQASRGLWSVSDYNPYYQLARVSFYLQEGNHAEN